MFFLILYYLVLLLIAFYVYKKFNLAQKIIFLFGFFVSWYIVSLISDYFSNIYIIYLCVFLINIVCPLILYPILKKLTLIKFIRIYIHIKYFICDLTRFLIINRILPYYSLYSNEALKFSKYKYKYDFNSLTYPLLLNLALLLIPHYFWIILLGFLNYLFLFFHYFVKYNLETNIQSLINKFKNLNFLLRLYYTFVSIYLILFYTNIYLYLIIFKFIFLQLIYWYKLIPSQYKFSLYRLDFYYNLNFFYNLSFFKQVVFSNKLFLQFQIFTFSDFMLSELLYIYVLYSKEKINLDLTP